MATTIRLTRMGRKKRPFYRLVVLDSRKRRDGAYLANLGYYNPFTDPHQVDLHKDEILSWLGKGAQVSETARSLLKAEGVMYQYSLVRQGLGADEVERKMAEWADADAARKRGAAEAAADKREAARRERVKREEEAKEKAAAEAAAAAAAAEGGDEPEAAGDEAAEGAETAEAADAETPAEAEAKAGSDDAAADEDESK